MHLKMKKIKLAQLVFLFFILSCAAPQKVFIGLAQKVYIQRGGVAIVTTDQNIRIMTRKEVSVGDSVFCTTKWPHVEIRGK